VAPAPHTRAMHDPYTSAFVIPSSPPSPPKLYPSVPPHPRSYLLRFLSRAQGRDCSAGVAALLSNLLQTQPSVFHAGAESPQPGAVGQGRGRHVLQSLTTGDASCHMVATPAPAGGDSVVCSARMAELFIDPAGYASMLLYTGTASFFFWPTYVRAGMGRGSGGESKRGHDFALFDLTWQRLGWALMAHETPYLTLCPTPYLPQVPLQGPGHGQAV
jgi:hypothetical protein